MRILLLLLLLTFVAGAQERREVEPAVDFLVSLYDKAGPRLGCRFLESSYLLTLCDWRARTSQNSPLRPYGPQDVETVKALNEWLQPQGLRLELNDRTLDLSSLGGLEYLADRNRPEWVEGFRRDAGWEGHDAWKKDALTRADANHVEGFLLGYPTRAVEGYLGPDGQHSNRVLDATIPQADRFNCGVPIFKLLAKDVDDSGITETERNWGNFLAAVYKHPRIKALTATPEFQSARRNHTGKAVEDPYQPGPNTKDERLLRSQNVAEKLEALPNLAAYTAVSPLMVRRWVLRAGANPDDPAKELAAVVRRKWPTVVQGWVRSDLMSALDRKCLADLEDVSRQPEYEAVRAALTPEQARELTRLVNPTPPAGDGAAPSTDPGDAKGQ